MQPYTAWQQAFDPLLTPGARNYWKSHNFTELSDGAVEALAAYAGRLPSDQSEIFVALVSGAANRVPAAAPGVLGQLTVKKYPRLQVVWADSKYHNHKLRGWIDEDPGRTWTLEVKRRPKGAKGFVLLPKRWVVERTHAWIGRWRRHSRDYERYTSSSEAMIRVSSIGTMLRRLDKSEMQNKFKYPRPVRKTAENQGNLLG